MGLHRRLTEEIGKQKMNIKVIGYDPNNIPRVWGIDNTKQMAVSSSNRSSELRWTKARHKAHI